MKRKVLIIGFALIFSCDQKNSTSVTKISKEMNCMQQVIAQDSQFGEIRNHASELQSLSTTILNYVNDLNHIDFSNCPDEFNNAFQEHSKAWVKMTSVTDSYSDLRGEMHELFNILEISKDSTAFSDHLRYIWDTWSKIETQMNINKNN